MLAELFFAILSDFTARDTTTQIVGENRLGISKQSVGLSG
jgi:hypothetical protein